MIIKKTIKFILSVNWKFLPPKKKKILVYDAGAYNPFHKYLKNYGYNLFLKEENKSIYLLFLNV